MNGVAEGCKRELELLEKAEGIACNAFYMRYETFARALEEVKFPYRLVQTWEKGKRGNLYYWNGNFADGTIYVPETDACIKHVRGIKNAIGNLKNVLRGYVGKEAA